MAGNARRRHAGIVKTSTPRLPILPAITLLLALSFPARAVVPDGAVADLVIGRQLPTDSNLSSPFVAVDPTTHKVFVADCERHRILRYSSAASMQNGAAAEAVLGQADFAGIERRSGPDGLSFPKSMWCDNAGRLWVADYGNNRVLRFNNAASIGSGAPANGVLGQVDFTDNTPGTSASKLRSPAGLITDAQGNLYIADQVNNRVLRFNGAASLPDGASASCVLGQPNFTTSVSNTIDDTHLKRPIAVALSPNPVLPTQPYLWVADRENHRVMRFNDAPHITSGAAASRVLGQQNFTSYGQFYTASGTPAPISFAADSSGRLYVGCENNRVLRFDTAIAKTNNAAADAILGQAAFDTITSGGGPTQLDYPSSMALGPGGRLWIADYYNGRVVRHEAAHTKVNGAGADGVLGAASTTTDMTRIFSPRGLAIDPVSGKLFVTDEARHRVLRFASVDALAGGAAAEAVFGQPNFAGSAKGASANQMDSPYAVAADSYGNLYVADHGNYRVIRFNNAAQRGSGVAADAVLGQPNVNSGGSTPLSASTMAKPTGLACGPGGELWVAGGTRVLRFDAARHKATGAAANGVFGQPDFSANAGPLFDAQHFSTWGLAADETGTLWVGDYNQRRILRFDSAATKINGAAADGVLGQPDFTSGADNGAGPDGVYLSSICVEPGGRLWVSGANNRVLRWEHAATRPNGADADGLIGQPDFGFYGYGGGLGQFRGPSAVVRDTAGRLWIADHSNQRVLRFSPQAPRLAIARKDATTMRLTLDRHARGLTYQVESSSDLQLWGPGVSFTAVSQNPCLIDITIIPGSSHFFRIAELP